MSEVPLCIVWITMEKTEERYVLERCKNEAKHSAVKPDEPTICCAHWPKKKPGSETPERWAPCEHKGEDN